MPEEGDVYTILKYLALVAPVRGKAIPSPMINTVFRWLSAARPLASPKRVGRFGAATLLLWTLPVSLLCGQTSPPPPQPEAFPPVKTSITVTGQVAAEAPAEITTVNRGELQQTPGINLDDRLRQVPGFSLFRRSSSLVANPTTQGVSLRGIGSTGASRTLVLWDGIPINDPFGGWVYWTRVEPEQIDDVEIMRGAHQRFRRPRDVGCHRDAVPPRRNGTVRLGYDAVTRAPRTLGGWLRPVAALWGGSDVRALTSDGYYIVPESIRGAVDTKAGVDFVAGNFRADLLGANQRLSFKLDILAEDRANGTVLQRNSTSLGTLAANYAWQRDENGISVVAYHTREEFRASFSSVAAGRTTERLTYTQVVPSEATGAAAYWTRNTHRYNLIAGADFERVEGYGTDRLVPSGIRFGGGSRIEQGTFAQFDAGTATARIFLGARYQFAGGGERFFSPSAGFAIGRGRLRFRGSGYRSFRAPTLNELYREFRVGNTDTLANPDLRSETLTGGEAGVDYGTKRDSPPPRSTTRWTA